MGIIFRLTKEGEVMKASLIISVSVAMTMMLSAFSFASVSTKIPGVRYTKSALNSLRPVLPEMPAVSNPVVYHGGPVISNAKIIAVMWGQGIDPAVVSGMAPFYTTMMASNYFDWYTEYNTNIQSVNGSPGTNQIIGKGSFGGTYSIKPVVATGTVSDNDVQTELNKQIAAGTLPKPDANTLYMVNFPKSVVISYGGMLSCQDFCAYHGSFTSSKGLALYGILPDSSDPSCIQGCGPATTNFQVVTTDASHEVGEAITDADVGRGNYAWQLTDGSEIGDPSACVTMVQNIVATDKTPFQVQGMWSNKRQACVFGP